MPNAFGVPEITVEELSLKLSNGDDFILMDVREAYEFEFAQLPPDKVTFIPLSRLARELSGALPERMQEKNTEIVVMCHTGQRSSQVTAWLRQNGWLNVYNLEGGIEAYAQQIDPSIGFY